MKYITVVLVVAFFFQSCKQQSKIEEAVVKPSAEIDSVKLKDTVPLTEQEVEALPPVLEKTKQEIKAALIADGFKAFHRVDTGTQDTIIMQQYFMVFLKNGPIRGQNEEEIARLQEQHKAHLKTMHVLGYADLFGSFEGQGAIQAVSVYNVPTLKMADSLARLDPMVKAGHFDLEIHPWWAEKGTSLR